MTISQLIQTISLGNFTYFMRFHGHFPHFLHKPWRIITGTAWQTADNRHWEGAHWARGVDLEHIGRGTLFECSLFGRSLAGSTLPRVILFQINRFPGTKTPHKQESVLFPGTVPPTKDRRLKQKKRDRRNKSLTRY